MTDLRVIVPTARIADKTPDFFSFANQVNVSTSTVVSSWSVKTIYNISVGVSISVSGQGSPEYRINSGAWTNVPGIVYHGDRVSVRHTSSSANSTTVTSTLHIEAQQYDFRSTTESAGAGDGFFDANGFWSTSLSYPQACSHRGAGVTDCADVENDGIDWNFDPTQSVAGNYTSVTAAANNAEGGGNFGIRFWIGDGDDINSGNLRVITPSNEPEMWFRWYQRYETGFAWSGGGGPQYDKYWFIRNSTVISQQGYRLIPGIEAGNIGIAGFNTVPRLNTSVGWGDTFARGTGGTSNGKFQMIEVYAKMNSAIGVSDGILRIWINGKFEGELTGLSMSDGSSNPGNAVAGLKRFDFISNQYNPANGGPAACDFDDIAFAKTATGRTDSGGRPWIGPVNGFMGDRNGEMDHTVSFTEEFEDQSWESRGWYDYVEGGNTMTLSSDNAFIGSTQSLQYTWSTGQTAPEGTAKTMRLALTASDNIYVSYWVKYSSGYQGSGTTSQPHEFRVLTDKSTAYQGYNTAANNNLALQIEQGDGGTGSFLIPRMSYANPDNPNGVFYNGSTQITTGVWHKVEAFIKLNTVSGQAGNADGIFKYWLDGNLEINATNVMMRDGAANFDALIDQFGIAPSMSNGSPINQTFWIDHLILGRE